MAKKDLFYNKDCKKCSLYSQCPKTGKKCEDFIDKRKEDYDEKIARRKALHKFYNSL